MNIELKYQCADGYCEHREYCLKNKPNYYCKGNPVHIYVDKHTHKNLPARYYKARILILSGEDNYLDMRKDFIYTNEEEFYDSTDGIINNIIVDNIQYIDPDDYSEYGFYSVYITYEDENNDKLFEEHFQISFHHGEKCRLRTIG